MGVCIGPCIAPVLFHLLAGFDVILSDQLTQTSVESFSICWQFFSFYWTCLNWCRMSWVSGNTLRPVWSTAKRHNPVFWPSSVSFSRTYLLVLWTTVKKPLLQYNLLHSKLMKQWIARLCCRNTMMKSCHYTMAASFAGQSKRWSFLGYPVLVQVSVAECLLDDPHRRGWPQDNDEPQCLKLESDDLENRSRRSNIIIHGVMVLQAGSMRKLRFPSKRSAGGSVNGMRRSFSTTCTIKKHRVTIGLLLLPP